MQTSEENALLTQVGPGTRMGALLRRYWHPLAAVSEFNDRWTKRVRILGEDLVLYKDRAGKFGLIGEFCPHRRASLAYGIPEADGIRCPYHGWKFDASGQCLDQPNEPADSTFKTKIQTPGYPVGELGGLLWGYLGPAPAPLIPPLDGLVAEGTVRILGTAVIDCNWLQIMENSVDPVHTEWLHGVLHEFAKEQQGSDERISFSRHVTKIDFEEFEYGIIKRQLREGQSEESGDWKHGHPILFPNILAIGTNLADWRDYRFDFRVPIDDTHTRHFWYSAYVPPPGATPAPELLQGVHVYDVPARNETGEYYLDLFHAQDIMAWEAQGPVMDRSREHLGSKDRGVTMYRRMLLREMAKIERGEDPMYVFRERERPSVLEIPLEGRAALRGNDLDNIFWLQQVRFAPIADELVAMMRSNAELAGSKR